MLEYHLCQYANADAGILTFFPRGWRLQGWDIGLEGMKVGGVREIEIPPYLAYGERGAPPDIPPGATLLANVELLNCSSGLSFLSW